MDLQTSSNENKLYYYNVDAILSELIRPPTPKFANLARPKLVKPAPIRPEQLVVAAGSGLNPFVLDDRNEGARNPDPSWAVDEDDAMFVTPTKSDAPYSMAVQSESNSLLELLGKRNRDDEDAQFPGTFNQVHRVPSRQNLYQDLQYSYSYGAQPHYIVNNNTPHAEEVASADMTPRLLPQLIKPIAMRPADVVERYHDLVQKNAKNESYDESMQVCG